LYKELATSAAPPACLGQVEIFFGDERDVPHDNVESNYNMAARTLLNYVPVVPEHVHPMQTDGPDIRAAARRVRAGRSPHCSSGPGACPRWT